MKESLVKNKTLKKTLSVLAFLMGVPSVYSAGEGYTLFKRISGTIPTPAQRQAIETLASQGNFSAIASMATQTEEFGYSTALRIAEEICNRNVQDLPYNDCSWTVTSGIVKDLDMRDVLFGDVLATSNTVTNPAPANNNNNHWAAISKTTNIQAAAVIGTQSGTYGFPAAQVGGYMTFRQNAQTDLNAGTNRAPWAKLSKYVLGKELKDTKSLAAPVDKINPDVTYYNSANGQTDQSCIGCHAQLDGFRSATAFHDFTNNRVTIGNAVVGKFPRAGTNTNNGFPAGMTNPSGFIPTNNAWVNNYFLYNNAAYQFRANPSRGLGTAEITSGTGLASMAKAVSETRAFSVNLARLVLDITCNAPDYTQFQSQLNEVADAVEDSGYNVKEAFAAASQIEGCIPSAI